MMDMAKWTCPKCKQVNTTMFCQCSMPTQNELDAMRQIFEPWPIEDAEDFTNPIPQMGEE